MDSLEQIDRNLSEDWTIPGYQKYHKLSNGQTIAIFFFMEEYEKYNYFSILLLLANKKRHIRDFLKDQSDTLSNKETGKVGLEGLIWAKDVIKEFLDSEFCKNGDIINISWTDNRRRDVYLKGLAELGFYTDYRYGSKRLTKKIIKVEK